MRKKQQDQMPLMMTGIDHPRAEGLKRISDILDQYPIISEMVWQDLTGQVQRHESRAHGMSAEQVLRAAIVKQTEGFSYEDLAFQNAKSMEIRKELYADLLKITQKVVGYGGKVIHLLPNATSPYLAALRDDLKRIVFLTHRVMDQTSRRVLHREQVPAEEKVVSLFEPHTDIIKKDRRETLYGHKVCLSVGRSNLVTDCIVLEGNPADSTPVTEMLNRHDQIYGRYPLKVALDGGFVSKKNLRFAKSNHVNEVCFAKKRGLTSDQMCRSHYVYKKLRPFRAGIESAISWLKRCFGLDRCTWKSLASFHSYVWASIVSANLLALARRANSIT